MLFQTNGFYFLCAKHHGYIRHDHNIYTTPTNPIITNRSMSKHILSLPIPRHTGLVRN